MYPTFFVTLIATLDPAIILLLSYNVIEPSVVIFISHGDEITLCSINTQFTYYVYHTDYYFRDLDKTIILFNSAEKD